MSRRKSNSGKKHGGGGCSFERTMKEAQDSLEEYLEMPGAKVTPKVVGAVVRSHGRTDDERVQLANFLTMKFL